MKKMFCAIFVSFLLLVFVRVAYCNTKLHKQYVTIKGVMNEINNNLANGQYELDEYETCTIVFQLSNTECDKIIKEGE